MSYREYGPNDDPLIKDGDRFFVGYNEKIHRNNLPEGFVSKSVNKRFQDGRAVPRKGTIMPPGNKFWYRPDFSQKFLGSFVYNNPNGEERLIMVPTALTNGTVGVNSYSIDADHYRTIGLPPNVVIGPNNPVFFAQGFDKLIMLVLGLTHGNVGNHYTNGLSWDGDDNHPFEWFEWNGNVEKEVIPPSAYAFPVSNRIIYFANYLYEPSFEKTGAVYDRILVSDIEDYQNLDPILGVFRINTGESDQIISVIPYAYDTLVIFMRRSIHLLRDFSFDFSLASQELLTAYTGTSGVRAPIQVGQEIYFFAEKLGVMKLSEVLEKRIMAHTLPVSDPIQPVIDRINWKYQSLIVSATLDNYLFFAVPLDASTKNNAVLVFNTTSGNWETIDTYAAIPGFSIDNLLPVHIGSVRRLVAIQNGPPALVYLLYEGTVDQTLFDVVNPRFAAIPDMIQTRGYGYNVQSGPVGFQSFKRGAVILETLNPNVKITAVADGVNEEKVVRESITKDALKFYPHGHADFNPRMDPWNLPKRKDYSVVPIQPHGGDFGAQSFEQFDEGEVNDQQLPPSPPVPQFETQVEVPQMSREGFRIGMIDRSVALRIENTQGQCIVRATSVESFETKRNARVAV